MDAIRGIVLGGSISDHLIVQATLDDLRRLDAREGDPVRLSRMPPIDPEISARALLDVVTGDGMLYDQRGRCVAFVTNLEQTADKGQRSRLQITAVGMPDVKLRPQRNA